MKSEQENEKNNPDERAITLEVDSEVIQKVRSGEITHILIDIDDDKNMLPLKRFAF